MSYKIFTTENNKLFFVHISGMVNEIENYLIKLNWKTTDKVTNKCFVILDDPLKRWINATIIDYHAQTFLENNQLDENPIIDYVLKNKIVNKINVKPQIDTIQNILSQVPIEKITFFKKSTNLGYLLNHYLHDNNIKNQFNNSIIQSSYYSEQVEQLTNFIDDEINRHYLNKVLKYLQDDYNFYNSVTFYAR
jgi:hypothetical protein